MYNCLYLTCSNYTNINVRIQPTRVPDKSFERKKKPEPFGDKNSNINAWYAILSNLSYGLLIFFFRNTIT